MAALPLFGVIPYTNSNASTLSFITNWTNYTGAPPAFLHFFGAQGGGQNMAECSNISTDGYNYLAWVAGTNLPVMWSMALNASDFTLAQVGTGAANSYFDSMASQIMAYTGPKFPGGLMYVRLGWEFQNAGWTWSVTGSTGYAAADYIAAFSQAYARFKLASPNFRIIWCPNAGNSVPTDPATCFPSGGASGFCDLIGLDCYEFVEYSLTTWAQQLANNGRGAAWAYALAQANNIPFCLPEWSTSDPASSNTDADGAQFVQDVAAWCAGAQSYSYAPNGNVPRNVAFTSWWDGGSGSGYNGTLEGNQYPLTGAAYKTYIAGYTTAFPWVASNTSGSLQAQNLLLDLSNPAIARSHLGFSGVTANGTNTVSFGSVAPSGAASTPSSWLALPDGLGNTVVMPMFRLGSSPSSPLAIAQAFIANSTIGVNIPRDAPTTGTYNGASIGGSGATSYANYLVNTCGFSEVGFSYPYNGGLGTGYTSPISTPSTSDSYMNGIITLAKAIEAAGGRNRIRGCDNVTGTNSAINAWIPTFSAFISNSSGLTPGKTEVSPIGEAIGKTNSYWNPTIQSWHTLMRANLKQSSGWVLGVPSSYWNGIGTLTGRQIVTYNGSTDFQTHYHVDYYLGEGGTSYSVSPGFTTAWSLMKSWSQANGNLCIIFRECAPMKPAGGQAPGAWSSYWNTMAQVAGLGVLVGWDANGNDGAFNFAQGTNMAFSGTMLTAIQAAVATVKALPGYGSGVNR